VSLCSHSLRSLEALRATHFCEFPTLLNADPGVVLYGQPGAEFALFSWLRIARGARYRQRILRVNLHGYTCAVANQQMVNCDHRSVLSEAHHFCKEGAGLGLEVASAMGQIMDASCDRSPELYV